MNLIVSIAGIATALFLAYLFMIQSSVKSMILMRETKRRTLWNMPLFLPVKLKLDANYPSETILRLSRKHDRLMNWFYAVLGGWAAFLVIGNVVQHFLN